MGNNAVENRYIKAKMSKMPNEKGKAHVITKGESLWGLAKAALETKGKATNAEISDYMLRIAKMNNLDTVEKMNDLKFNSTIYIPDDANNIKNNTPPKRCSAEESALDAIQTVLNDETVFVKKPALGKNYTLYHVYNKYYKEGYLSNQHLVMSFNMEKDGRLTRVSFEDINQDINKGAYDYDMDSTGRIYHHNYKTNKQQIGKLNKDELQQLEKTLSEKIKTAQRTY